MKIALLGAGGFIGSHLVEHLLALGVDEVIGMDLTAEKLTEVLALVPSGDRGQWTYHDADVGSDADAVRDVVQQADVVIDLVAHANPSLYVTRPLEVFELNFMQNLAIARLCGDAGVWLVQASSAEVYGKSKGAPYNEDTTDSVFGPVQKQRWIYAAAKHLLERVLYAHGEAGDLRYTVIRPFNFLGPRMDYLVPAGAVGGPRVFPHFMSALLSGGPIRLVDGGRVRRAFVHVADGVRAFASILDAIGNRPEAVLNQTFNVGNPANEVTIRELAGLMLELYAELTGVAARSAVEEMDGEAFYGRGYEDSDREAPNIAKIRGLGWEPQYDLRMTLRETMRYYLDRPSSLTLDPVGRSDLPDVATHEAPRSAVSPDLRAN